MQRRGAASLSPRSIAWRRETAPPCVSSIPRPQRSFSASASVYWVTEARLRTCCRTYISRCARLNAGSGQASFVAAVSEGGDRVTIVPAALLSGGQQKAFELWLIPPGDKPHSLGLIDPSRPVRINVPKSLLPQVNSNAVLAVSLEPPGGSPIGQPTGPVIANGKLASL